MIQLNDTSFLNNLIQKEPNKNTIHLQTHQQNVHNTLITEIDAIIKCTKCYKISSRVLKYNKNNKFKCCTINHTITFYPQLNDTLYFDILNSCLIGLQFKKYILCCVGCGTFYECEGKVKEKCFVCKKVIFCYIKEYKKDNENEKKDNKLNNSYVFTCKHYKKSTNCYIFPCCNTPYPCDICHNEKEYHPLERALKYVCGKCGKINYVNQECCKSVHWEGGKGCRDKSRMGRKDKQKYKR